MKCIFTRLSCRLWTGTLTCFPPSKFYVLNWNALRCSGSYLNNEWKERSSCSSNIFTDNLLMGHKHTSIFSQPGEICSKFSPSLGKHLELDGRLASLRCLTGWVFFYSRKDSDPTFSNPGYIWWPAEHSVSGSCHPQLDVAFRYKSCLWHLVLKWREPQSPYSDALASEYGQNL